jgi:hypothetical protein
MSILVRSSLGAKLGAMCYRLVTVSLPSRSWPTPRGAYDEDSIYFEHVSDCRDPHHHRGCPGRWRGSVSQGFGPDGKRLRRKVSGRTKTEVKDRLQLVHDELREGIRSSPRYTVQDAVDDFLAHGLEGRSAKWLFLNLSRGGRGGGP